MQSDTQNDNVFSVSEVNRHIKNIIENMLGSIMIEGEISSFSKPGSGHLYFNLKDESSSIKCVFFKQYNMYTKFSPKNGDKVICAGKLAVYERDGVYQLQVMSMHLAGQGLLQLKFNELKKKLETEGLFDKKYKKPIPEIPKKIGIITSASGAAFQDICNVIGRRFPVKLLLYPATVQGEKAPTELVEGLKYFNRNKNVDVIIIGRGGGSQEDLFCFNDEELARAIFKSQIPVISAVGHEIDFTICDFVSDLRAPTPSAAAELVVPDKTEIIMKLLTIHKHLKHLSLYKITKYRNFLYDFDRKVQKNHPEKLIHNQQQLIDQLSSRLRLAMNRISRKKDRLNALRSRLESLHPRNIILVNKARLFDTQKTLLTFKNTLHSKKSDLIELQQKLQQELQYFYQNKLSKKRELLLNQTNSLMKTLPNYLTKKRNQLNEYQLTMNEYSPKRALEKGYAIIKKEKRMITSAKDLNVNDKLNIDFKDGNVECLIEKITVE